MAEKNRILIVDDDTTAVELTIDLLNSHGFDVDSAASVPDAIKKLDSFTFKVIVTDIKMPDKSGMELLDYCIQNYQDIPVIMLTAFGTIRNAVESLKKGAFDYLLKPVQIEELIIAIEKAITNQRLKEQNIFLKQELARREEFFYYTKNSELKKIYQSIENISDVNSTVLLMGESGTGKEVIARYIHKISSRASESFVPINCGAIPEGLIESELFGYEKGAFTDAKSSMKGKLEIADGGTLFLDEIDEMPPKAQVALLRFIQDRELVPLGTHRRVSVNVRIITATNRDLIELIKTKKFREDLYYRISVLPYLLPPLRKRREDILPLAEWFLERFKKEYNRPKRFIKSAEEALLAYDWPGNIRELRNSIERATIIGNGEVIDVDSLFLYPLRESSLCSFDNIGIITLREMEKEYIHWVLKELKGNKTLTAGRLGISVRGLRYKVNSEANKK